MLCDFIAGFRDHHRAGLAEIANSAHLVVLGHQRWGLSYQLVGLTDEVVDGGEVSARKSHPGHCLRSVAVTGFRPAAQVSVMTADKTAPVSPDFSVEVDDVDAAYAAVRDSGAEIVHPLQDEEWGVRRFFVRDPSGRVVNVLNHR